MTGNTCILGLNQNCFLAFVGYGLQLIRESIFTPSTELKPLPIFLFMRLVQKKLVKSEININEFL